MVCGYFRIIHEFSIRKRQIIYTCSQLMMQKEDSFRVVIIYGADKFETGDIEEDRRLLYVAMTRAEKYLFMTEEYMGRSTLLGEIGQNMNMIGGKTYA